MNTTSPELVNFHQTPAQGTFGVIAPKDMAEILDPSDPSVYEVDYVAGYEGITFLDVERKCFLPPPDLLLDCGSEPHPAQMNWNIPTIAEDDAKEAFIQYVTRKRCYNKTPAREMVITDLQPLNTYRYRFETFTESRSASWKSEPYWGEVIDSPQNGAAPLPWAIRVDVPDMFKNKTVAIKVPHTSSVTGCPVCQCSGRKTCTLCWGQKTVPCLVCPRRRYNLFTNQTCTLCAGRRIINCEICHGQGTTACRNCGGKAQLLSYIEVQVEWKNNVFEYAANQRSGFPTELFQGVNGNTLFVNEQNMVYPVLGFPESAINQVSRTAIEQHQTQFASTTRILRQRQTIELVFISKVEYEWNGKSYSYYVYGNEHKVYADDYPRKCCYNFPIPIP
ncbi:protein SSUH2 homolog [Sceloporus undulatus]|uniref:protein SSUH2 homolog n=1 Tax=Sceloporus undulatus TaxID=8520 RepID=UPI001C4D0DBD|nr:protein SSUH2 homolog [Sceloporus undulatus]